MKNKIRVLSLIMTLAIVLSSLVIVVPVGAEELIELKDLNTTTDGKAWTEFSAEGGFAGGSGTSDDPWQIATAEQLALFAEWSNDPSNYSKTQNAYFVLTADIDLAGHEWVAIAKYNSTSYRFFGHFDGQGHTIKNMTVTKETKVTTKDQRQGLFGYTGGNAVIENFTLTGSIDIDTHTNASSTVALVVSEASGWTTVQNVNAYGVIDVITTGNETPVAGIIAKANSCNIINCTMNGSITVTGGTSSAGVTPVAGGMTAYASAGLKISGSTNNADITLYANGTNSIAGGFVGKCGLISGNTDIVVYGTYVTGCVNNGNITVNVISGGKTPSNQRIGGIVGNVGRGAGKVCVNVEITKCVNTGVISIGSGVTKGGGSGICQIAGWLEIASGTSGSAITISECYALYKTSDMVTPHYNSSGCTLNGETFSGYGITEDSDINFAIDTELEGKNAVIRISKVATDAILATGGTLDIAYGDTALSISGIDTLAEYEKATEAGRYYEIRLGVQDGATATATLTATYFGGTDLEETLTLTAKEATWSDFYTESFAASQTKDEELYPAGSESNPYIISSAEKLASLADRISKFDKSLLDKYFVIVRDIDLSAHEWQPIGLSQPNGTTNGSFTASGTILGYDHTISGVRLTQDSYYYSQSFFGYSRWNVYDLVFDGIEIKTCETYPNNGTIKGVCGLIAAMYGGTLDNVHVRNLDLDYVCEGTGATDLYISGMVGYLDGGTVTGCSVSGEINVAVTIAAKGQGSKIGGVASRARAGKISDTVSNVTINVLADNSEMDSNVCAGGFVGFLQADQTTDITTIQNCINNSDVTLDYSNKGGNVCAAGFIGAAVSTNGVGKLLQCVNNGTTTVNHVEGTVAVRAKSAAMIGYFGSTSLVLTECVSMNGETLVGETKSGAGYSETDCGYVDLGLETENKASVRLDVEDADDSGLAFTATFDTDAYAALVELGYDVTFGMVIAPTAALALANGNVAALSGTYYTVDYDKEIVDGKYKGAIVNMGEENVGTAFSAVPYVTLSKYNEESENYVTYTFYGDFDELGSRSVLSVVTSLLNDRSNEKTDLYTELTDEGDFSPYAQEKLDALRSIYFPVVEDPTENEEEA